MKNKIDFDWANIEEPLLASETKKKSFGLAAKSAVSAQVANMQFAEGHIIARKTGQAGSSLAQQTRTNMQPSQQKQTKELAARRSSSSGENSLISLRPQSGPMTLKPIIKPTNNPIIPGISIGGNKRKAPDSSSMVNHSELRSEVSQGYYKINPGVRGSNVTTTTVTPSSISAPAKFIDQLAISPTSASKQSQKKEARPINNNSGSAGEKRVPIKTTKSYNYDTSAPARMTASALTRSQQRKRQQVMDVVEIDDSSDDDAMVEDYSDNYRLSMQCNPNSPNDVSNNHSNSIINNNTENTGNQFSASGYVEKSNDDLFVDVPVSKLLKLYRRDVNNIGNPFKRKRFQLRQIYIGKKLFQCDDSNNHLENNIGIELQSKEQRMELFLFNFIDSGLTSRLKDYETEGIFIQFEFIKEIM